MGVEEGGVSLIVELESFAVHNEQFLHTGFMLPDSSTFLLQVCTSLKTCFRCSFIRGCTTMTVTGLLDQFLSNTVTFWNHFGLHQIIFLPEIINSSS